MSLLGINNGGENRFSFSEYGPQVLLLILGLSPLSEKATPQQKVKYDPSLKNETVTTFCHEDLGRSHSVLLLTKSAPSILESCLILDDSFKTIPMVQTSFRAKNCRSVEIKIKTNIFKENNFV